MLASPVAKNGIPQASDLPTLGLVSAGPADTGPFTKVIGATTGAWPTAHPATNTVQDTASVRTFNMSVPPSLAPFQDAYTSVRAPLVRRCCQAIAETTGARLDNRSTPFGRSPRCGQRGDRHRSSHVDAAVPVTAGKPSTTSLGCGKILCGALGQKSLPSLTGGRRCRTEASRTSDFRRWTWTGPAISTRTC